MFKYFWQENGKDVEVLLENEEGFEWICNCGLSNHQMSKVMAQLICDALNAYEEQI